jgi:hypothetical protein
VPKRDLVASLEVPFHKGSLKVAEGLVFWPALREELFNFQRKINQRRPTTPASTGATPTTTTLFSPRRSPVGTSPGPPEVADDPLDQRHEDGYSRLVRGPKRVRENCRAIRNEKGQRSQHLQRLR